MTLDDEGYPTEPTLITSTLQEYHDGGLSIDEVIARLRHYNWKAQKWDTGHPLGDFTDIPTERYGTWDEVSMAEDDGLIDLENLVKLRHSLAEAGCLPAPIKEYFWPTDLDSRGSSDLS